jgi:radical SAM protein with 4Fe4S-binding SPASM domain
MLPLFHTLYFETTRNCNLNCQYCSTGSNTKKKHIDITKDQIVKRIFEPAWDLGTNQIEFSGGEFLTRKDAFEILEIANKIGFKISVVSNGTILTDKVLTKLKTLLGDNILISLGVNEFSECNNSTRDYDSNKILELIKRIESFGITINMCVTVGKFNSKTFKDTIQTIDNLKLPYNRIPLVPRSYDCRDLMFDEKTMKEDINPVLRKYFRGYVSYVPFFLPPDVYESASSQNSSNNPVPTNPSIGCWVGSFYGINPEGEVAPCPLLLDHVSGGNVLKTNLKGILFESELFSKIVDRSNLKGKCKDCKYNYTCGGCRTMAFYKTGDIFGEDPDCFIDSLSEAELKQAEDETIKGFKNYNRMTKFANVFKKGTL